MHIVSAMQSVKCFPDAKLGTSIILIMINSLHDFLNNGILRITDFIWNVKK